MNSKENTIQVNASSLVDLKAELLRKQEEFKKARLQNASRVIRPKPQTKKTYIWSKQNVGVLERSQQDAEVKQQEEQTEDKARVALEAKAKLYEQMTSGRALEDGQGNEKFLVDFERKAVSALLEKRDEERMKREEEMKKKNEDEAEEEKQRLAEKVPPSDNPDEQWVDFVDGFGRERRCLRKDLPALKKLDESIGKSARTQFADKGQEPELLSTDMRREIQRQKWEQEQEEMLTEQPTVHYSNVQFDEIRAHGVGFYQFSKKEQERQEQLKMLDQLRQQTLENRVKKERMLDKRKAIMKARMAKIKQRRLQREGRTVDDDVEDNTDEDDWTIGPKLEKPSEPEPLTRDDTLKKDAPMRDWDRGKPAMDAATDWLKQQQAKREQEFAPPQMYYESAPKTATWRKDRRNPFNPKWEKPDSGEASVADTMESVIGEGISAIRAGMEGGQLKADNVSSIPLSPQRGEEGYRPCDWESEVPTASSASAGIPPYSQSEMPPSLWSVPNMTSYMDQNTAVSSCSSAMPVGATNLPPNPAGTAILMPPYHANTGMLMPPWPVNMSIPPPNDVTWMMPPTVSAPTQIHTTPQGITAQTTCHFGSDVVGPTPSGELPTALSIQQLPVAPPQPAHYTSAPMKPQPKQGHYERVNMQQVPLSLPVPPIIGQEVKYPSMESVFGKKPEKREEDRIKYWKQQFGGSQPKGGTTVTQIPFPAPNIQKEVAKDDLAVADFDLSKPPPNIEKKN